jgi:hypothetical protein
VASPASLSGCGNDCHRLAKDNDKGNGSYRYDHTNPTSRKPHYPPPPAVPTTGAAAEFEAYKPPNRVVALHVNHGLPTKAAEMYAPYDNLHETKPYLPYKKMDVTYTNVVKTKKPYTKSIKSDVIDLTGVNVNGTQDAADWLACIEKEISTYCPCTYPAGSATPSSAVTHVGTVSLVLAALAATLLF